MYSPHREEVGIPSRLIRLKPTRKRWKLPSGGELPFPLILDVQSVNETTERLEWRVEAHLDLISGQPKLTGLSVVNSEGIDADHMQSFFRWRTPLDVVLRLVPDLVERGIDPFEYEIPTDGYPDATDLNRNKLTTLSDEFLREIALQYRHLGRGYSTKIAKQRGVSRRTVVSWVEKARRRGIIGKTRPGKYGEE